MEKTITNKPWGDFEQFTLNEVSTVKILKLKPNSALSLQKHQKRDEFWRILSGSGFVELNNKKVEVKEGDEFFIKKEDSHRASTKNDSLEILEISFGFFDEDDIKRLADIYGRL